MMNSTLKTQFAIIGDPVEHSLSPHMHNAAFKKLKLPYSYEKIQLKNRSLKSFFKALRKSSFQGLNVTIPHKEAVLPYVDEISEEAKIVGAINTLLIKEGKILGFNTDGAGYLESLRREKKFIVKGKSIFVLGAGGAARGILAALGRAEAKKVYCTNRHLKRAQQLTQEFSKKFKKTKYLAIEWKEKKLSKIFPQIDLLIQTTSLGLKGENIPECPLERLNSSCLVSDIIYSVTPFLKKAKKLKLKTLGGSGMLLYQGVLAFEIWTSQKAPVQTMKRALIKCLSLRA